MCARRNTVLLKLEGTFTGVDFLINDAFGSQGGIYPDVHVILCRFLFVPF